MNTFYPETMDEDELAFIQCKHDQESRAYMYTMNRMLFLIAFIPLFVALFLAASQPFSWQELLAIYFIGFAALLVFFGIVATLSYYHKLHKFKMDLKHKIKVVEQVVIKSTQYMPQNNTWHFFIHSLHKVSIEVSEEFFNSHQPNDEINIEYSKYSKEYFGYF